MSWHARLTGETGNGKLPSYFPVYDRHFSKFKGTAANVLEVGVWKGTSLSLWKDYFGPDACIAGLDINQACAGYDDPGYVKVYIGNQADRSLLDRVWAEAGPFDVVIDDGSHAPSDIRATFEALYPRMGLHGVYLIEDTHTQVNAGAESFLEYAKALTDRLNDRYRDSWDPGTKDDFVRHTRSVHFYDSVVVFERGRSLPYKTWTGVPWGA